LERNFRNTEIEINLPQNGFLTFQKTNMRTAFQIPFPEESIPKDWLLSSKIIIFDFNHYPSMGDPLATVWKPKNN